MTLQPNDPGQPQPGYSPQSPTPPQYGQAQYGQAQHGQTQYGQAPHGQANPGAPVRPAPKPPLDARAKRGAMIAGAVSFTIMAIGSALAIVPASIALIVGVIAGTFALIASSSGGENQVQEWFDSSFPQLAGLWLLWLGIFVVLGIVVWVVGFFVSIFVLRSNRVARPGAVTWSALGVGIVASTVVNGIIYPLVSAVTSSFGGYSFGSGFGTAAVVITAVLWLACTAAIGLFSWWWMAHALRPKAAPVTA